MRSQEEGEKAFKKMQPLKINHLAVRKADPVPAQPPNLHNIECHSN